MVGVVITSDIITRVEALFLKQSSSSSSFSISDTRGTNYSASRAGRACCCCTAWDHAANTVREAHMSSMHAAMVASTPRMAGTRPTSYDAGFA